MTHTLRTTTALGCLCTVFLCAPDAAAQEAEPPGDAGVAERPEAEPEPQPEAVAAPLPEVAPPPADEAGPEGDADSKKKKKKVDIGGRLHAGYGMIREAPAPADDGGRETENEFDVRRAMFKLRWRPEKWLDAVLQIDLADAFELGASILTDAYIDIEPLDQLEIRFGQFKKPFSALALQSPAKIRVIERGPGVDFIATDLLYGDRDLGLKLSGVLVKSVRLEYEVGAFNGSGPNVADQGNSKDLAARLQFRPLKQLEIGAGVSAKFISEPRDRQPGTGLAGGGDARLEIGGFRLYAEGLAAQDHQAYLTNGATTADDPPLSFAALSILSYRHWFRGGRLRAGVEPAFKAELFDPDADIADDHLWVFTPGINGYFGSYLKLMLNGEFTRSNRNSPDDHPDSEAIKVLLCFDI